MNGRATGLQLAGAWAFHFIADSSMQCGMIQMPTDLRFDAVPCRVLNIPAVNGITGYDDS